ncbi:hypothetical protein N7G274_003775 [Stereocaulon virgatum]|uniref:Uncharacterized protein n=1 Tax=Stereocaulon virgatum TaxID=373712 RepID=A0ABR4ACG1_9LECA
MYDTHLHRSPRPNPKRASSRSPLKPLKRAFRTCRECIRPLHFPTIFQRSLIIFPARPCNQICSLALPIFAFALLHANRPSSYAKKDQRPIAIMEQRPMQPAREEWQEGQSMHSASGAVPGSVKKEFAKTLAAEEKATVDDPVYCGFHSSDPGFDGLVPFDELVNRNYLPAVSSSLQHH